LQLVHDLRPQRLTLSTSALDRVALKSLHLAGFKSRYLTTSDGPMHVLEAEGSGPLPPLVLLHGFGASAVQLLPILLRLKKHVQRIVAPDLPGHGFSSVPSDLIVESFGRGTLEILEQLITDKVVLFGNSMGGAVAIRFALQHPGRIERLILCSPGGAAMGQLELDRFRETFFVEDRAASLEFVDKLLGRRTPLRPLYAYSVRKKLGVPALQRLIRSIAIEDLFTAEQVNSLSMPVLMLWGEADGILPRESREFFRKHLPQHAIVEEPARVGHSPYLESPGLLTKRIVHFLSH
jgi:pimeloyl-ACP methyl ester carboxylesterase